MAQYDERLRPEDMACIIADLGALCYIGRMTRITHGRDRWFIGHIGCLCERTLQEKVFVDALNRTTVARGLLGEEGFPFYLRTGASLLKDRRK